MNDAHLHLLVNHFPIVGLIVGTIILIIGLVFKSATTRKAGLFAILMCAVFAIPSFSTGEGAEEVVEHMPNMSKETHHLIHEHEEKAEFFMPFAWILMILSAISLFFEWKKNKFTTYLTIITLVFSLIGIYLAKEVGTSGGEISHPEIRKGFVSSEHEEHED